MVKPRKPASGRKKQAEPGLQISEEEQWRLVEQSGVLKKASDALPGARPGRTAVEEEEEEEEHPYMDEAFAITTIVIPMSFLLLLMHILIHFQYGQKPDYGVITERMLSGIPILTIFIAYTNHYKRERWVQVGMFVLSVAAGTRMVWQVNRANWLVNMQQLPPLGTLWVYTIVQLDLAPSVIALGIVGFWTWWTGLKIIFD
ncbi:hypothetical protein FA95DRAFT_1581675 [Auriscalpium vulgare]|uniref:Uncharacterized protein n=1 Tax=Auriscalpium vulgare TaxID=40419 RepID=A0ACB8S0I6_9AGAM|nr:hypothetical protein FA95DRAFT_1581675 [Auriscalpium vulgare]